MYFSQSILRRLDYSVSLPSAKIWRTAEMHFGHEQRQIGERFRGPGGRLKYISTLIGVKVADGVEALADARVRPRAIRAARKRCVKTL